MNNLFIIYNVWQQFKVFVQKSLATGFLQDVTIAHEIGHFPNQKYVNIDW